MSRRTSSSSSSDDALGPYGLVRMAFTALMCFTIGRIAVGLCHNRNVALLPINLVTTWFLYTVVYAVTAAVMPTTTATSGLLVALEKMFSLECVVLGAGLLSVSQWFWEILHLESVKARFI
eukprot:PhM_4_TR45/c0_g1_i1/m.98535